MPPSSSSITDWMLRYSVDASALPLSPSFPVRTVSSHIVLMPSICCLCTARKRSGSARSAGVIGFAAMKVSNFVSNTFASSLSRRNIEYTYLFCPAPWGPHLAPLLSPSPRADLAFVAWPRRFAAFRSSTGPKSISITTIKWSDLTSAISATAAPQCLTHRRYFHGTRM